MTSKTFIRLMLMLVVVTAGLLLVTSSKIPVKQAEECPTGKEKQDDNKATGDLMIWESISQQLLSAVQ